jgi:peptidoglycan/LPS O-acetylase OafA/YrhL
MELLLLAVAPPFGVMLGLTVFSRLLAWIASIVEAARGRRAWPLTAAALLHSGPWLLAATLSLAYYTLPESQPWSWWWWFFGGVLAAPFIVLPVVILAMRRKKAGIDRPPGV